MSLADAFKHKNNVTTIAERGVKLGRSAMLGVLYDELARFVCRSSYGFSFPLILLCRMEWEDLSGKLGSAFCIENRVATICPALERRAEILHDEVFGPPTLHGSRPEGQGAGAGKGQGGGAPKTKQWQERWCTFCNKQGHTVEFLLGQNPRAEQGSGGRGERQGKERRWQGGLSARGSFRQFIRVFVQGKREAPAAGEGEQQRPAKAAKLGLCFNCGEPGHKKADCPKPPKE